MPKKRAAPAARQSMTRQYTTNAVLSLAFCLAVLINLLTYALYQDQLAANAKLDQQLYHEQLKREYFEWRETTATGHKTDKANFPRWDEIEAAGTRSRQ